MHLVAQGSQVYITLDLSGGIRVNRKAELEEKFQIDVIHSSIGPLIYTVVHLFIDRAQQEGT